MTTYINIKTASLISVAKAPSISCSNHNINNPSHFSQTDGNLPELHSISSKIELRPFQQVQNHNFHREMNNDKWYESDDLTEKQPTEIVCRCYKWNEINFFVAWRDLVKTFNHFWPVYLIELVVLYHTHCFSPLEQFWFLLIRLDVSLPEIFAWQTIYTV